MEVYLVGGAVRDFLMDRKIGDKLTPFNPSHLSYRDRDWVVVGSTQKEMLSKGFKQVGKDFPTFLHPKTNEEYSLARKNRSANGWTEDCFDENITLEQDLLKRDLTINSIAMTTGGVIIDPSCGMQDLYNKVLRMTSIESFVDDPIRILRIARFAAKFPQFAVDPVTMRVMKNLTKYGNLYQQQPERIWKELSKGLMEIAPSRMLQVLRECGALEVILPEVNNLYGVIQPEQWHPEIDTGVHIEQVLERTEINDASLAVRFAALVHDVGKGLSPKETLPAHHGHEERGVKLVRDICERLKVSDYIRDVALLATEYHGCIHGSLKMKNTSIVKFLRKCDAFRRPERFHEILKVAKCDAQGRWSDKASFKNAEYPQEVFLSEAWRITKTVNQGEIAAQYKGREDRIPSAIHAARARAIRQYVKEFKNGR